MFKLLRLSKSYPLFSEGVSFRVLDEVDLTVRPGSFIALMGPSGSGKSTLLNCLGMLDREYEGSYQIDGQEVSVLGDIEASHLRNQRIGFVFQSFHLFPELTALENVMVPMEYARRPFRERRIRAAELLERVGLADRMRHTPLELSGGQQQRVALARAFANQPDVILADEPTGNLDSASSQEVVAFLKAFTREGKSVVMVTHNPELVVEVDEIFVMDAGRLYRREAPPVYRRQRDRAEGEPGKFT